MKRKRAARANSGRAEHRAARASSGRAEHRAARAISGRAEHRAARASSGRAEHRLSLCPQVLAGRLHHDVAPRKLTATTSLSYANQQSKSIKKKKKKERGRGGVGWGGMGGGSGGPPNMHNTNLPVLFDTPLSCAETSVPLPAGPAKSSSASLAPSPTAVE